MNSQLTDHALGSAPCELLEWDTGHFRTPIARVRADQLNEEAIAEIDQWCLANKISCVYGFCSAEDRRSSWAAEAGGFHLADLRMTLEKTVEACTCRPCLTSKVHLARMEEVPALEEIAAASHHDSRFYFDPGFDRTACDSLYRKWIRGDCEGGADAVLVAGEDGRPGGYLTCHLGAQRTGRIGLVAVAAASRGQGLGSALIDAGLAWFAERGVRRVSVVTQGRNAAAQRLYQRRGFVTYGLQFVYHKWYPHGA